MELDGFQFELSELEFEIDQQDDLTLKEYLEYLQEFSINFSKLPNSIAAYIDSFRIKHKKFSSVSDEFSELIGVLEQIRVSADNGIGDYSQILSENIKTELKENFQVERLSDLVSFGSNESDLELDDLASIGFGKDGVRFQIEHEFVDNVSTLSNVVFYESPAYWKVRDALVESGQLRRYGVNRAVGARKKFLTGVPKYFYDLDIMLRGKSMDSAEPEFQLIADELKEELGGELVYRKGEFVFREKDSKVEMPKNLLSLGMTNLGVIHSLLNNNIISKGSFLIIDEPETNLHPEWQVLLMKLLIKLSENEVTVVIATHSTDMLKAVEVMLPKSHGSEGIDAVLSVHYLNGNERFGFVSSNPIEQLAEARMELLSPYEELLFS